MVFQAVIDESYDDSGILILAGCISTTEKWAEFSRAWERMLRSWGRVDKDGNRHFHMTDMMQSEDCMFKISEFFNVLYKYTLAFVSVKISSNEFYQARNRIYSPTCQILWESSITPYLTAYRCLMDKFHSHRDEFVDYFGEEKIDFIFDEHSEKKSITSLWDEYKRSRAEDIRKYYGSTPSFRSDKDFLPLQGADLIAGLVRLAYKEGQSVDDILDRMRIEGLKRTVEHETLRIGIEYNEDDLAGFFKERAQYIVGRSHAVFDRKLSVSFPRLY